jgi:hypothetical protein
MPKRGEEGEEKKEEEKRGGAKVRTLVRILPYYS